MEGTNHELLFIMDDVLRVLHSVHEMQESKVRSLEGYIRSTMMANLGRAEEIEQHSKNASKRRKNFFSSIIQNMNVKVRRATSIVIGSK